MNDLLAQGFSQSDAELITVCKETNPHLLLEAIKKEKNSYVTNNETFIVDMLMTKSPLNNNVINILIHYVLVVQKNSQLQNNFINKIATNWAELGIKEPEQAIKHVRKIYKASLNKQAQASVEGKRKGYKQKPIRKETLPDWFEEEYKENENPAIVAEMEKRMQEYLKNKNKEEK